MLHNRNIQLYPCAATQNLFITSLAEEALSGESKGAGSGRSTGDLSLHISHIPSGNIAAVSPISSA